MIGAMTSSDRGNGQGLTTSTALGFDLLHM